MTPQGAHRVERLTALVMARGAVCTVQATRLVAVDGTPFSTVAIARLVRRGLMWRWNCDVVVASTPLRGIAEWGVVALDPAISWSCDADECHVECPTLQLQAASATWERSRIGALARIPAGNDGFTVFRRVTVTSATRGASNATVEAKGRGTLDGTTLSGKWPGALSVWPIPTSSADVGYAIRGEFTAGSWPEPAMRAGRTARGCADQPV